VISASCRRVARVEKWESIDIIAAERISLRYV